jgi:MFS family permease
VKPSWRAPNVVALGFVSLFTDAASEMIIPLLPIFLTTSLGAGALALGWIEGLADAVASTLKLYSGRWSDRMGRRKPLVLSGYGISTLARPLVALAMAPWHVVAVRVADRVGKGLRSSPRDALIADSVPSEQRAAAYSLNRAMDHTGAIIGPLLAVGVLALWPGDLRTLFWLSAIPGSLAVLTIVTAVRDRERSTTAARPTSGMDADTSPRRLLPLLVPLGLFTLGNASDVFLLLKVGSHRHSMTTLPLLWMALHVVKTIGSVPGGKLADRFGRSRLIALGWLFYAGIYTAFAFASSLSTMWLLFVAYGLYHALTEGPEKALVADLVPAALRGTAFGWYHLTIGLLTLAANLLFGLVWDSWSARVAFLASAAVALLAVVALMLLRPETTIRRQGQALA